MLPPPIAASRSRPARRRGRRTVGALLLGAAILVGGCGDDADPASTPPTGAPPGDEPLAPAGTEPESTEPASAEPVAADPLSTEPVAADPVPVARAGTGTDTPLATIGDLPVGPPTIDVPALVGALETWNRNGIELADGRIIVRGRLVTDDPVETWSAPLTPDGVGEPVVRADPPIRLFLVDLSTDTIVGLSGVTAFHTFANATGEHRFYEIPLAFDVDDDEAVVRFTTGWNGAGYDVPYTLWETPIPPI